MKAMFIFGAAVLLAGLQAKPINTTCPVKGTPVKPSITVEYKGKTIGFC